MDIQPPLLVLKDHLISVLLVHIHRGPEQDISAFETCRFSCFQQFVEGIFVYIQPKQQQSRSGTAVRAGVNLLGQPIDEQQLFDKESL